MSTAQFSAASRRNRGPILGALRRELAACRRVLEIGAGCGCHATAFAEAMPWLVWQPSDIAAAQPLLGANLALTDVSNVLPPLTLDVCEARAGASRYDAVYSANTAHIMDLGAVRAMFGLAADVLGAGGCFACYGPFRREGRFDTDSNAAFDSALRARDPAGGIRDLEELDAFAAAGSLVRTRLYAMPANNLLIVWKKTT